VQKEVSQRLISPIGTKGYGSFTVIVDDLYEIRRLFDVSASCFYPAPNVDSSVVQLKKRPVRKVPGIAAEDFAAFVRACFAMR